MVSHARQTIQLQVQEVQPEPAGRLTGEKRETAVKNRDLAAQKLTADQLAEAQRFAPDGDTSHPR